MERQNAVSKYLASIGSKGGQAKVAKGFATLSAEERKAIAAKGVKSRARARAAAKKQAQK